MNTFGKAIRLTTFGESHGPAMGGILDGIPPLVPIDIEALKKELSRRRPGSGPAVSARNEPDEPEFLSGLSHDGVTLGSPIGFIVRNKDCRSADYDDFQGKFRPNHADYTYYKKYGIHDFRGGGRASARETVSWVIAGAICRQWIGREGISIKAVLEPTNDIAACAANGDSTGGIVRCRIDGVPLGLGEPVFDKLHARLSMAMMGINAAKAFEYGDGFRSARMLGSESADMFCTPEEKDATGMLLSSNHCGGMQGGISNSMPIEFKVYFKPTPTIMRDIKTIDSEENPCVIHSKGRHDPCVAVRAVPVVEAMAALTIADFLKMRG
ncbi:MAG: chorismate synthase [Candidatus Amulumruptor caecigallinarius]|nr:chorismate synthase [Candidatus Amulumruptor caecigallinarius]